MPDEKDLEKPNLEPTGQAQAGASAAQASALDEAKSAFEGAGDGEGDEPNEEGDAARQEAILRRVQALGEEDELEKVARAEEAKLAERRKALKKGKRKGGLEAAASKRLAKIGAKAPVQRSIATAADADPLIDRAAKLSDWAKKNQKTVGILVAGGLVAAAGVGIYGYTQHKREGQASVELAKAVADERGRIGDPDKEDDPDRPKDPRPVFKTAEDRREAALREYRDVESRFPGTGAAILARLSEGSILLDKRDVQAAVSAFSDVKESLLAKADAEVRGRALEGLGFAYELKAADLPDNQRGPALSDALKSFRELENTDVDGFKELGMYHQARVDEANGDKDKAIELLKSLHERVNKPTETKSHPFPYLQEVADDRLRALNPSALPPKAPGQLGGPGGNQLTEAQIRRLMEQMQRQQGAKGGAPLPPPPPKGGK